MCVCITRRRIQLTGSCCVLCYLVVELCSTLVPTQIFFFSCHGGPVATALWMLSSEDLNCDVLSTNLSKSAKQNKTKQKINTNCWMFPCFENLLFRRRIVAKHLNCLFLHHFKDKVTLWTNFKNALSQQSHLYLPFRNRSVFPSPDTCLCFWVSVLHDRKDMNTKP